MKTTILTAWMFATLVGACGCGGEAQIDHEANDAAGVASADRVDCNQFNTGDGASNNVQNCGDGQVGDNSDNGNTTDSGNTTTTCTASDHSQGKC
jgi:hypothetical protein